MESVRADAAWVGWGFVAEHPDFADLCREMDIEFIGQMAEAMRRLGDKISSKRWRSRPRSLLRCGAMARWRRSTMPCAMPSVWLSAAIKSHLRGGGHGIAASVPRTSYEGI